MFFDSWSDVGRTLLVGLLAYTGLVVLLRVSGKRTLSKMNAFDFVVTVALGSTLATALLSKDVALAEAIAGLAFLIFAQYALTWLSARYRSVERLVKAEPSIVLSGGRYLPAAMRRERVTEAEVRAAIREAGHTSVDDVAAVVLETDGSFTVLAGPASSEATALAGVEGREAPHGTRR